MKAGYDGQFFHGELLCRLLVAVALAAYNFCRVAQVLRLCKPAGNGEELKILQETTNSSSFTPSLVHAPACAH